DERVVAVGPADALGGVGAVLPLELHAGDALDDVDEVVDGDELIAADVDRIAHVAGRQPQRAVQAVVDVGEAAGLLAVAPDLDRVVAGEGGGGHLAADGGRRLLASTVPRAVGAVDVVV